MQPSLDALKRWLGAVVVALSLSACANASELAASTVQAPAATDKPASDLYRLGVADKIRMLVYNEPSLSGEFAVNANGSVAVPLIGEVTAAGRTTTELQSDVEAKLRAGYLREPHVSIDVLSFRPFFILGEVNNPGEYPYSTGLTVLNAVATAKGFTYRADKRRVYIRHLNGGPEETIPLTSSTVVAPGDTVRIGERYF